MKVNILGTKWTIKYIDMTNKEYDGMTDSSSNTIYIRNKDDNDEDYKLDNFKMNQKRVIRHELIHAFLHESGLGGSMFHSTHGHDEQMVDWFARIYPKYKKVCTELKV